MFEATVSQRLRSFEFGVPQTRARLYVLMVDASLMDRGELSAMAHLISHVLPASIPKRSSIEDVMFYNSHVQHAFETTPHHPPVSKDPWPFPELQFLYYKTASER